MNYAKRRSDPSYKNQGTHGGAFCFRHPLYLKDRDLNGGYKQDMYFPIPRRKL